MRFLGPAALGYILAEMKPFFTILGCILALGVSIAAQQKRGGGRGFAQPEGVREVTVTAIPGVVAQGAQWTLAWQGTDNADGIIASSDGGLLFAQEQPNHIGKLDRNDKVSVFLEDTQWCQTCPSTPRASCWR